MRQTRQLSAAVTSVSALMCDSLFVNAYFPLSQPHDRSNKAWRFFLGVLRHGGGWAGFRAKVHRPKPGALPSHTDMPPLQGANQRSVHVETDGSQIRLFLAFLIILSALCDLPAA